MDRVNRGILSCYIVCLRGTLENTEVRHISIAYGCRNVLNLSLV